MRPRETTGSAVPCPAEESWPPLGLAFVPSVLEDRKTLGRYLRSTARRCVTEGLLHLFWGPGRGYVSESQPHLTLSARAGSLRSPCSPEAVGSAVGGWWSTNRPLSLPRVWDPSLLCSRGAVSGGRGRSPAAAACLLGRQELAPGCSCRLVAELQLAGLRARSYCAAECHSLW